MSTVTFHITPFGKQAQGILQMLEANQLVPTFSTLEKAVAGDIVALFASEASDRNPLAWIAKYKGLSYYLGPPTCTVEGSDVISIRYVETKELTEQTINSALDERHSYDEYGNKVGYDPDKLKPSKLPPLDLPEEFRRTVDGRLVGLRSGYRSWWLKSGDNAFVGESAVNEALGKYGFGVEDYKKAVAHFGTRMYGTS